MEGTSVHICKLEDKLWELALSFHHWILLNLDVNPCTWWWCFWCCCWCCCCCFSNPSLLRHIRGSELWAKSIERLQKNSALAMSSTQFVLFQIFHFLYHEAIGFTKSSSLPPLHLLPVQEHPWWRLERGNSSWSSVPSSTRETTETRAWTGHLKILSFFRCVHFYKVCNTLWKVTMKFTLP